MKNIFFIIVVLILVLTTSCAAPDSENKPAIDETTEEETNNDDEELVENEQDDNNEELINVEVELTNDMEKDNDEIAEEIKVDTGTFNGLADSNFFEVKISGVPDSVPPKMFMLNDDIREKFQGLNLQQDDVIKIYYYETTDGQLAVTDIEKIS